MSAAEPVFDTQAGELLRLPGVARRRMFGDAGLTANGRFFAFADADRLVVKLPPALSAELIGAGEAIPAELSPSMRRSWVSLSTMDSLARWRELLDAARTHADSTVDKRRN
jgi:TfoX/Sxy family transcriptional regulator of competence genes